MLNKCPWDSNPQTYRKIQSLTQRSPVLSSTRTPV